MVDINSPREEIVAAWLARLRDPNSKRAIGYLKFADGYCCLGHLCEVLGLEPQRHAVDGRWYYEDQSRALPFDVVSAVGLASDEGEFTDANDCDNSLSHLNDSGRTLAQIADIIESRPPGLFVEEERP